MMINHPLFSLAILSIFGSCSIRTTTGFAATKTTLKSRSLSLYVAQDIGRPPTFLDEHSGDDDDEDLGVTINWIDEEDDDVNDDMLSIDGNGDGREAQVSPGRQRWENLNPNVKQRLIEKGQAKAVANKKKREPKMDKKRRKWLI